MYRDKKLRKLMDMYSILESASSCEFTITKPVPQSNRMTKFGRKKVFGEAFARRKTIKEEMSEEEFLNGMFDKFVEHRNLQEGPVLRAIYHAAVKKWKGEDPNAPDVKKLKRPIKPVVISSRNR